jgi:diguanylate cyclase (GGDEF)-like protein
VNPAPVQAKESSLRRFDADSRAYAVGRLFLLGALGVLFALNIMGSSDPVGSRLYLAALGLFVIDTIVLFGVVLGTRVTIARAMMAILLPDLLGIAVFTFLGRPADSFYPAVIMTPIFYAFVVSKRDAWVVGFSVTAAYVVGLFFIGPQTTASMALFAFKAGLVPIVAFLVANSVDKQRSREQAAEHLASETEHLNAQLRRRVHELQAVSTITELIHSSLDFDRVGPQVLEIVAQAIGVTTCCLFVIDKSRSETLFSASRGTAAVISDPGGAAPFAEVGDDHLTCAPVFDMGSMMVLFCSTPEALASLSDEERLVLSAVASELVVAVENSRLYKLTRRLAITDELTGLANYRHLQQRLDEELARAKRYEKHLSLLMLDADHFKEFNDHQGHVAGDVALAELGPIVRRLVREVDVVARYGGEEFSIVLPETDAAGAYIVAEKVREAIELHHFADADGRRTCSLSVSIGLATYPTHATDKDSLLREADDALYHAKRGGKNRVRAPQRYRKSSATDTGTPEEQNAKADEWTGA